MIVECTGLLDRDVKDGLTNYQQGCSGKRGANFVT